MSDKIEHVGSLLSGTVTCSCGFKTQHYAMATDAMKEFDDHLTTKQIAEAVEEYLSLPPQEDIAGTYPGGWFGPSWGAPINDPESGSPHRETPVGQPCFSCKVPIVEGDRGMLVPFMSLQPDDKGEMQAEHLNCFLQQIAVNVSDEVFDQMNLEDR